MSRFRGSKNKKSRRFGCNLFGRKRNPMLHKKGGPGQHGSAQGGKKRKKKSEYGEQLEAYSLLKTFFSITKTQFINYYVEALKKAKVARSNKKNQSETSISADSNVSHILLTLLASRLDFVVYTLFAPTIFSAHQLVSHGHVRVNGKKVDRRSFRVSPGDVISLTPKGSAISYVKEASESKDVPVHLTLDKGKYSGTMVTSPSGEESVQFPFSPRLDKVCPFIQLFC